MTPYEHIRALNSLLSWAEGALHGGMCGESADRLRDMRRQLERETVDDDERAGKYGPPVLPAVRPAHSHGCAIAHCVADCPAQIWDCAQADLKRQGQE